MSTPSVLKVQKVQTLSSRAWQDDIDVPYLAKTTVIPRHPFRLVASGPSGTGKTNVITWMLIQKLMYKKWFDEIHIICPSASDANYSVLSEIYEDSKITELIKYDGLDEKTLSTITLIFGSARSEAAEQKEHTKKRLFILDDVISDKNILKKEIKDLFFSGRHASISVAITAQSYMKVPRDIRLNATNLFLFGMLKNESETNRVLDEHRKAFISKEEFKAIVYDSMKPEKDCEKPFLHINYQGDDLECYRKCFEKVYEISD